MKNGGGHFAPKLGGHFELESGGHFKLELGGQYHWNLQTGGISYNYIIDKDATEKNIDVSSNPFGLYKVALVTDGQIVDVKILSKQ